MADDKLIFPIGFDLNKGVKEVLKDGDKAIERLYNAFAKKPITVKLRIDSGEALSRSTKTLSGLKKEMAEINREWNALSAGDRGGVLGAQIMARYRALTQEAKGYTSTVAAAVRLEDKLARERERSANAAEKAAQKTREYNKELSNQSSYVNNLLRKMVVLWSIHSVQSFLTGVRDVTAEFELQRVSLGAIIQDQQRANQLFSEIKSFALQSPLKILDLTKYTKQVAAYGIETEKLFDTTKRLADVSVGLGVDMGRLVLAYGQVKAASYLRAAEIRQFTEAGIPMLELLAKKFTDLQGKMVSTEQVMDLVSKRAVSFSMVEGIFNDMTSAGGMFYNMQEKQAQTLFGMWSKLGDAAAMMYDEIGNTGWVNDGMKTTIGLLESMMRNWRGVTSAIGATGFAFVALKGSNAIVRMLLINTIAAAAATRNYARAQEQLNAAKKSNNTLSAKVASLRARAAAANRVAANSTNLWTVANYKLRASLLSLGAAMRANWVGLLLSAIAALVSWFISARQEANRLNNELSKMSAEGAANADAMARNFERLAKVVVESADGSKKQHEALEELKRTYSDIIPAQNLTIEKLRAMKGVYEDVTKAIREKIYQQNLEQQLNAIQGEYQEKLSDSEGETTTLLKDYGLDANEIGRVMGAIKKAIDDGILDIRSSKYEYAGVLSRIIKDQTGLDVKFDTGYNTKAARSFGKLRNSIEDYVDAYSEMTEKIKERTEYMEGQMGTLGEYTNEWKRVQKEIADNKIIAGPEDSQFLVSKQNDNRAIQSWAASLKDVLGNAWDEAFVSLEKSVGEKGDRMSYILFDKLMPPEVFEKFSIQQQNYIKQIRDEYNNLIPQDRTVASMRNALERIALQTGVSMDEMKRHLMNSGESWEDYSKRIRDSIKEYESEIDKMIKSNAAVANGESGVLKTYSDEEIKKVKDAAEALKLLLQYLVAAKGGGRTSDPRLQNLKEEISLTKKLYDEYQKLEKQIGTTKAAEKIQEIYSNTIKTLQDRAKKYGFEFELPFTDKNLKANMQHFIDKMKELQKEVDKKGKPKFPNIGKEIDEAVAQLEDVDFNSLQKALEKKLKELADRISRTKTAKEFYDKVLGMTGDYKLAATFSMSVYGNTGERLKDDIVKQIESAFKSGDKTEIDLSSAINYNTKQVDYAQLRRIYDQYQDHIIDKNKETARKLIEDGEKASADQVLLWLKDLEKAKTFAEKRVELAQYTANQIAAIEASALPQEQKTEMVQRYKIREDKETAKLEYETFKSSPMYVAMFEKLDAASTTMLENMKKRLMALKGEWKNLDPTQIKELQSRLDEVNNQLAAKNPYRTLIQSFKEWKTLREQGTRRDAEQELINKTQELERAEALLVSRIQQAEAAQKAYNDAVAEHGLFSQEAQQAKLKLSFAEQQKKKQAEIVETTRESTNEAENLVNSWKSLGEQVGGVWAQIDAINQAIVGLANDLKDAFGGFGSEADAQYFDDMVSSFSNLSSGITNIGKGIATGNPVSIIQGIGSTISGIVGLFTAGKVRRANKEIERQQELLDQLDYTYGRLEKAADKLFGRDYLNNYNQQLQNLQAQQAAYEKQAQAERSKGKKEDKQKTQEYLDNARDTADKIKDLQDDLAAHFTGQNRTDAARQMAMSWIDARASMSDTFAAIKGDYADMIKNMIVEGAAARVIENALSPMWDKMDDMLKDNDIDGAIDALVGGMDSALNAANNGMEVLWKALEARGYDMKQLIGDIDSNYTGIAKEVSSATSEEINANTAALNTQNYYMSHVPQIAEHVAAMRQLMERATTVALPEASAAGWTDWQKQAMDNYNAIARNTAETVAECRRSAAACEAFAADIHRMIEFSGGKHRLNVKL